MSWFNCAAIQDSCLCSTLHFLFPVFVGCCLSAPQHNSNLTNEVRVAVVTPVRESSTAGADWQLLCRRAFTRLHWSVSSRGEGRETITISFSRVVQVIATSAAPAPLTFFSPGPTSSFYPTGLDRIPRYTLLAGLADWWMQHAITSRNRHSHSQVCLLLLSPPHTHITHTRVNEPLAWSARLLHLSCVVINLFAKSAL